jgi:hypothetical protein
MRTGGDDHGHRSAGVGRITPAPPSISGSHRESAPAAPPSPSPEKDAHGGPSRAARYEVEGQLPVTPRRPFGWWCRECGTYTAVDDEDVCEACALDPGAEVVPLLVAYECACGRRVQAARPVLREAAIRCGRCGGDFTAVDDGEGRR